LCLGSLFGAGIFVTTCVVGGVAFVSEAELSPVSFLKDVGFFIVGVTAIIAVMWDLQVTLGEAIYFTILYLLYSGSSVAVHYYKLSKANRRKRELEQKQGPTATLPAEDTPLLMVEPDTVTNHFTPSRWYEEFESKTLFGKVFYTTSYLIMFPLIVTIPESVRWNRFSAIITPTFSPIILFMMLSSNFSAKFAGSALPVWGFLLIIGFVISCLVFCTTTLKYPPRYFMVAIVWCFLVTICWIYLIANELVNVLLMFGNVMEVADIVVGATVLASGNSVSDMVADILLAKQGFPKMAVAATYATPAFNTIFGLGMSLTYQTASDFPISYEVVVERRTFAVVAGFLLFTLVSSLIVIAANKFVVTKQFGIYLIALYSVFVMAIALNQMVFNTHNT